MKNPFVNHPWLISVLGSVIFAILVLPMIIIFNHGTTTDSLGDYVSIIGQALLSLLVIYCLFWLVNYLFPSMRLGLKLVLVILLSIPVFGALYLFYWKIIIRSLFYGIPTSMPTMGYFKQVFAAEISMHLPVCFITLTTLYNQHLRKIKTDLIRAEKLVAEGNLQQLTQQVDPHFLFNNLNILSALITINSEKAHLFTVKLAEIYRQLLQSQKESVISLEQELAFARNYFFLLTCRFENSLDLQINMDTKVPLSNIYIIPLSLQFLIENVVKHNILSADKPMTIIITIRDQVVWVTNPVYKKNSTLKMGVGLNNLKERYYLLTGRQMEYVENDGIFTVVLPIIRKLTEQQ